MDSLLVTGRGLSELRRACALAVGRALATVGAAAVVLGMAAAAGQADALHVIPFPGTPDASPSTQIIFSALAPAEIRSVRVVGTRSGSHSGRLTSLPAGAGTAFVPGAGFSAGERVDVQAALASPTAAAEAGAPGRTGLRFSFTVARPASVAAENRAAGLRHEPRRHSASPGATQSFHSAPQLHPPAM